MGTHIPNSFIEVWNSPFTPETFLVLLCNQYLQLRKTLCWFLRPRVNFACSGKLLINGSMQNSCFSVLLLWISGTFGRRIHVVMCISRVNGYITVRSAIYLLIDILGVFSLGLFWENHLRSCICKFLRHMFSLILAFRTVR